MVSGTLLTNWETVALKTLREMMPLMSGVMSACSRDSRAFRSGEQALPRVV
ncbi:MAG: hypothetical protein Q7T26_07260 [Dehalococcoidia bacterium]|nr:hypothetical protein [Dehalococcoidia bacterium]